MNRRGTRGGLPGQLGRAYRVRVQEHPLEEDEAFDPTYDPVTGDQSDHNEEVEEEDPGDAGYESLWEFIDRRGYVTPPYLHYDIGDGEEWQEDWESDDHSRGSHSSSSGEESSGDTTSTTSSSSFSSESLVSIEGGEEREMQRNPSHNRVIVLDEDSDDGGERPRAGSPTSPVVIGSPEVEIVQNQPSTSGGTVERRRARPENDSSDSEVELNVRRRKRSRMIDSQEDEEEAKPSTAAAVAVKEDDDDDENGCMICYEEYTTSGDHRLVSLKCGHFFGRNCIERWIRAEGRSATCPTCKGRAAAKDIRPHFVKSFKVADNSEMVQMKTSNQEYKRKVEYLEMDNARLNRELREEKKRNEQNIPRHVPHQAVINLRLHMHLVPGLKGEMCPRGSTVASRAFDHNGDFFAVGVHSPGNGALFRPYAIRKVNFDHANQFKTLSSLPLHANRSRVVVFSPFERNILLSAGEDKMAVVHSMLGSAGQREWKMPGDRQVWSACWISENRFAVGLQDGRVYEYEKGGESSEPVRDVTQGIGHFPIIFLAHDVASGVLVVASFKKVIAFCGDRAFPLISNDKDGFDSIRSVAWDARSLSFAVTFSAGAGKTIVHRLYRLDIDNSAVSCIEVETWVTPYVKCTTMWNNCLFSLEHHGIFSLIFCEDNRTLEAHDWSKKRQDTVLKFSTTENVCAMKALSGGAPNTKTIAVLTERSVYLVNFRLSEDGSTQIY